MWLKEKQMHTDNNTNFKCGTVKQLKFGLKKCMQ